MGINLWCTISSKDEVLPQTKHLQQLSARRAYNTFSSASWEWHFTKVDEQRHIFILSHPTIVSSSITLSVTCIKFSLSSLWNAHVLENMEGKLHFSISIDDERDNGRLGESYKWVRLIMKSHAWRQKKTWKEQIKQVEARAANAQQLDPIRCKNPAPFGEQKKKSRNLYQSFC